MASSTKGQRIKVEPIREMKDIKAIKRLLSSNPRDLAYFVLGINTNLRASDALALTVGQVRRLKPMDEIEIREKKTRKIRRLCLNRAVVEAINDYLDTRPQAADSEPLFMGRKGRRALGVPTVSAMVKRWCHYINLKGNYASHSLRKTFGYHQRVTFGVGLPELMVAFNHSSQKETLNYLCIQPDEVRNVYLNEI